MIATSASRRRFTGMKTLLEKKESPLMTVNIRNWQEEISNMADDPNVSIRYVLVSVHEGKGLYSSIIPPGNSNTGHYHPEKGEYYHIVKGSGVIATQQADQLESGAEPVRQRVVEGMSFALPPGLVHRLFNDGHEPLTFFFECPLEHMAQSNPVRTAVKDFGDTLRRD